MKPFEVWVEELETCNAFDLSSVTESASGMKTAVAVGIVARIGRLHQDITRDRSATKIEKNSSLQLVLLASLIALWSVTGNKAR